MRASERNVVQLRPRAWKPAAIEMEGRLFFVHPDGKVYERVWPKRPARGVLESEKPLSERPGGTIRRVKDKELADRVRQGYLELLEKKAKSQDRAAGIVRQLGITKKPPEDNPPDAAA